MKISREELELIALKHAITSEESIVKMQKLNISKDHFNHIKEGCKSSYTKILFTVIMAYYEESDGSLLTEMVLSNKMLKRGVQDIHKMNMSVLWEEVCSKDYDANELHEVLLQLKEYKAMSTWNDMYKNAAAVMAESGIERSIDFIKDHVLSIESEMNTDAQYSESLDFANSADFFQKEYQRQKEKNTGIQTGYTEIDSRASGWMEGEVAVVLAPSGGGKSIQLLNWAFNAHEQGKNVLYFSFELNLWQCYIRHLSLAFSISYQDLKRKTLDEDVIDSIVEKLMGIGDGPYFQYDFTDSDETPDYIDLKLRELKSKNKKPDLIVVDYIGQMTVRQASRTLKSWERHELAFDGLIKLAKKHSVPILTAQQINRDAIKDSRRAKDSGRQFTFDQSSASGGQHIMHQSHYVFIIDPDRETNISVIQPIKCREIQIPSFCIKVDPEHNAMIELSAEEQDEMRKLKGIDRSDRIKPLNAPTETPESSSDSFSTDDLIIGDEYLEIDNIGF